MWHMDCFTWWVCIVSNTCLGKFLVFSHTALLLVLLLRWNTFTDEQASKAEGASGLLVSGSLYLYSKISSTNDSSTTHCHVKPLAMRKIKLDGQK